MVASVPGRPTMRDPLGKAKEIWLSPSPLGPDAQLAGEGGGLAEELAALARAGADDQGEAAGGDGRPGGRPWRR